MKKTPLIFGLVVLVALGFLAWRHFFPNEEKRIRKLLISLATAASIPMDPKPLGSLAAANELAGCFTPDCEVNVDIPEVGRHVINGQQEIAQTALAARSSYHGVKVEFLDVAVVVDPSRQTATVEVTARVTQTGQREFAVEDLKMSLRKYDNKWRIAQVETAHAFKK